MKNYEITEEQIKEIAKGNAKVKKWFTEVFETKLEAGKWYKYPQHENWKLFINEVDNDKKEVKGYCFTVNNDYFEKLDTWTFKELKTCVDCAKEEVLEALTNEAKKKYKIGDYVKCNYNGEIEEIKHLNFTYLSEYNILVSNEGNDDSISLFLNGVWAEIVKTYTKEEAEKILNAKIV